MVAALCIIKIFTRGFVPCCYTVFIAIGVGRMSMKIAKVKIILAFC